MAHHDQQIAEISEIITDQWKLIEGLKSRLSRLGDKIEQMECNREQDDSFLSPIEKVRNEKPPHY
ncbi:MAG: SlyX family protein [Alphaproteobacteria bacterium]|nr:SlyX family protein [Alphaproteobacteria bacterium]